jgi:uncharacterized protein (DUF4415 family)
MNIRFEWDPAKAASNLRKHGVGFDTAKRVFTDPFALMKLDRVEGGEQRWEWWKTTSYSWLHIRFMTKINPAGQLRSSASFRLEQPIERKGDAMSKTIVRQDFDLAAPPPLTEAERAELTALASRPDSAIDYSDIPPLTEEFWKNAVRNPFYKPTKTSTTVRIDSDVLLWLRAQGKGYQSRINAILRREMLTSFKS